MREMQENYYLVLFMFSSMRVGITYVMHSLFPNSLGIWNN